MQKLVEILIDDNGEITFLNFDIHIDDMSLTKLNSLGYKIVTTFVTKVGIFAICDYNSSNKELGTNGL